MFMLPKSHHVKEVIQLRVEVISLLVQVVDRALVDGDLSLDSK